MLPAPRAEGRWAGGEGQHLSPRPATAGRGAGGEGHGARTALVAFALLCSGTVAAQVAVAPLSAGRPGTTPPPGWSELTFPKIERHTRYELVPDGGTLVVAATAEASASGWIHRLDVPAANARMLRWRWKAIELPAGSDLRTKAGDDAAARIYVTFRYAPERLAWPQRLLYDAVRAFYGEAPPHATLMYVWDAGSPQGATFANPYTDRARNVVVESGATRLNQWLDYERDVLADYRAAFGEEPPPISGIAIMTDADNTRGRAAARYGDVTLSPR
jgi:hypothetical protein